jgi:hypothetical protein
LAARARLLVVSLLALSFACGDEKKQPQVLDAGTAHGDRDGGPMHGRDGGPGLDGAVPVLDGSVPGLDGGPPDPDGGMVQDKTRIVSVVPDYTVAGEPYKYAPKTNETGQTQVTVKSGPSGMTSDGTTVAWEPQKAQAGKHEIVVEAKAGDQTVEQTATVTVASSEKRAATKSAASEGGSAVVTAPNSKIQGAGISVVKGSTSSDQPITISEVDATPKMPGKSGESQVVQFGPSGTVFATPALVALPLPRDVVLDAGRLGAFVQSRGRWERVPVVRADLENRVLYARALHFSPYVGAMNALGLELDLHRAPAASGCDGALVVHATMVESLDEVESDVVNNASAMLSALIEGGADSLESLILADGFTGSLRFVRVVELVQGSGEQQRVLEQASIASTLFVPGDGSAVITHADALGNELGRFAVERTDLAAIEAHLRGATTKLRLGSDAVSELAVAGRMYVVYYAGDASLDPASTAHLGAALIDQPPGAPLTPAPSEAAADTDCDQVLDVVDDADDRFAPALLGVPTAVVSTVVGADVLLAARLVNAPLNAQVSWEVLGGEASLATVQGEATQRRFSATAPGVYQVEARSTVGAEALSHVFFIDVAARRSLPSCTPAASVTSLTLGESAQLSAVFGESDVAREALGIEWGVMNDGTFQPSAELFGEGERAVYTPALEGTHRVACRAGDGAGVGTIGTTELAVLPAGTNRLPIELTVAPQSVTLLVNETVVLKASATDLDGDVLSFTWSSSGGVLGVPSDGETASAVSFSSPSAGLHDVHVSIEDGAHLPQLLIAQVLVIEQASDLSGADADGDGWPAGIDCDDGDAAINPTAVDRCGDQVDEDCSGSPRSSDCDGDGQSREQGDCDDASPAVHTGAVELCDGIDNDCEEGADDGFGVGASCSAGQGACHAAGVMVCTPDGAGAVCNAQVLLPALEVCDGADNDCDGATDEDYQAVSTSCGQGLCAATGVRSCIDGQEVDSCTPGKRAQADTLCDGLDEDCDGQTDEEFTPASVTCGVGACERSGSTSCLGGELITSCQEGSPAADDTVCNGVDDDCNGETDEDFSVSGTSCGRGACAATGTLSCVGGSQVDSCTAGTPAANDSLCDGLDNDCDGAVDEEYTAHSTSCGTGACAATGTSSCVDGEEIESCTAGAAAPSDADCDGVDDDCNGTVDEDFVPQPTSCGIGACSASGMSSCVQGQVQPNCTAGLPAPSDADCDGLDDDCSGQSDEDYVPQPTSCGTGECAASGTSSCVGGVEQPNCTAGTPAPSDADCDGRDDDCSGQSDEDYLPHATSCGIGDCSATGMSSCVGGVEQQNCTVGQAAPDDADCDGRDDDCSGAVDEDYVPRVTSCGTGACLESGLSSCEDGTEQDNCVEGEPAQTDESCDGVDDDCDGEQDEDHVSVPTDCGEGACESSGLRSCVNGAEQDSCAPGSPAGNDVSCDGVDQDCNGEVDDAFVSLLEVCNGKDDDCDGEVDNVDCPSFEPEPCEPTGEETCNVLDDDCDGQFDEGNVCGLVLTEGTIDGVWWMCEDPACVTVMDNGLMFAPDQAWFMLRSFDGDNYHPVDGPYCQDGEASWTQEGDLLVLDYFEDGQPKHAEGTVDFDGLLATITWSVPPEPGLEFTFMRRVPEQPGGLCNQGPSCQPTEDCKNGFDDDCDGSPDTSDPDCMNCQGEVMPEVCDGLDNDCDGHIDDLSGTCQTAGLGICQLGQRVCMPDDSVGCVAREPDPAGEVCPDGLDNDCDGEVDEPGCLELTPGETCFNPIDVSAGGVFEVDVGQRNDLQGACRPAEYNDRAFVFSVPSGLGLEYTIRVLDTFGDIGGGLSELPQGWEPAQGCPGLAQGPGMCVHFAPHAGFKQFLSGGSTYLLTVESFPERPAGAGFTLSIARSSDGVCFPGDQDGDGVSICEEDCHDGDGTMRPGAEELCNDRDDDCDGIVDEQEGTCPTGLTGVCGVGLPSCAAGGTCTPIQGGSPVDYCNDDADNDCNGSVDDACVDLPGEACTNAIDLGVGGTFAGTLSGASDDALSRCGSIEGGAEKFYRLDVPPGAELLFDADEKAGVRYVMYRDCTLEPVSCHVSGATRFLEPGSYLIAVEQDEPQATDYRFTVALQQEGTCLTPDFDGDGFTICANDCDEANPAVNPDASEGETCDQLDNDCNQATDDLREPCSVEGQLGVCAEGALRCAAGGLLLCEPQHQADPQGRDFCGDGLDNDCDGAVDDTDPQLCTELPDGDVCTLAEPVGPGGMFSGSLEGYGDDANVGCGDGFGGPGAFERYYAIALGEPRRLRVMVTDPGSSGGSGSVAMAVLHGCGQLATHCSGGHFDQVMQPGTYFIAVMGDADSEYELLVATMAPEDPSGSSCSVPDSDGDGYNLCNGDCREGDPTVNYEAPELCDGIDNDCNFVIDDGFFGGEFCSVEGGVGECGVGFQGCQGGEMVCVPSRSPGQFPEVCSNEIDEDCDGPGDDNGEPGVDCAEADGESCPLARPLSPLEFTEDSLFDAQNDGLGCYGGVNGDAEDVYYSFDTFSSGTAYVFVKPLVGGTAPEHAVGMFGPSCSTGMDYGCRGPGHSSFFVPGPGTHHIVLESDDAFAFELQFAFRDSAGGECSTGDRDGDGFTLCDADCDDSEPSRFYGASEVCDGIDNDCNGVVDDIFAEACETALPGICQQGHLACDGFAPSCVPNVAPRSNDICSDELDNDCDGVTDEAGCDVLPGGETCGLAVDVSGGGAFAGSLSGATHDDLHCGPSAAADTYFQFTLEETAVVYLELLPTFDAGGEGPLHLTGHLFQGCSERLSYACASPRLSGMMLDPGEYTLAVEANREADFALFLAFDRGLGCEVAGSPGGDFDGDGTSLCANDCQEGNAAVHPGAPEVCNNFFDDDCNGYQDSVPYTPCESAEPGECAAGRLECPPVGSGLVCMPIVQPGAHDEVCGDGLDNDCDQGVDEPACVPPTGDRCELAINLDLSPGGQVSGSIGDAADDVPGCNGQFFAEKVYRVTAPVSGFMYAQATAQPGFTGSFTVRNAEGNCFGPAQCQGFGGDAGRQVTAGSSYFLVVDGPVEVPFTLRWAMRPGEDEFTGPCLDGTTSEGDGDFDGDGETLCQNDCDESTSAIHSGATELCGNERDDDCDSSIDEQFQSCDTGLLGACQFGTLECFETGAPAECMPQNTGSPEICNAFDDDCDGELDEGGVCG